MNPTASSIARQGRPTRRSVDIHQLARRILTSITHRAGAVASVFPSERELAGELGVSRHAVRGAIDYLAQRGAVQRLPGGGAVRLSRQAGSAGEDTAAGAPPLRCINFLQGPSHLQESLRWLMQEYLVGYTEVLDLYDIKTRFLYWADDRTDFEEMFWPQASRQEQGCVLLSRRDPALLGWLNEQRVPYVMQTHAPYNDEGLPPHHRIYINKVGGAFDATRHLLDLGHRRIGFVGAMPSPTALTVEYEGWLAAMRCAGLTPRPEDAVHLNTEELEMALEPCRNLLRGAGRPTAVFAGNGTVAVGLLEAAVELGLNVPADLSIIGFTGNLTTQYPQLSVVESPRRQLAHQAVELLLNAARGQIDPATNPQTCILPCQLMVNGSTAPPAPGAESTQGSDFPFGDSP